MFRLTLGVTCLMLVVLCAPPSAAESTDCRLERTLRSTEGARRTAIVFRNNTCVKISIYWLDYSGNRKLYQQLLAGKSYTQRTFATHPWVVAGPDDACVGIFFSQTGTQTVDIGSSWCGYSL